MFAQLPPLFPEQASTTAPQVDALFFFLLAVTGAVAVLITVLILWFAVKYRRRVEGEPTPRILGSTRLEVLWSAVPLVIFLLMFAWGARVYYGTARPPDDALEVYVVGKQWMWKLQHTDGQREIKELHVPVNRAIKLTLTSEDVIHDFAVPDFRLKIDVLPGRYVQTWFQATKTGPHHLFCDQYCGTDHAGMVGTIVVMEPAEYADWLAGAPSPTPGLSRAEGSLALQGRKLFLKLQCITCHSANNQARAPVLENLYGTMVNLQDGRTVKADAAYIRESILYPQAKVVQGWQPIMPTFKGLLEDKKEELDEEEALIQLIAFIKELRPGQTPVRTEEFPPPLGAPTIPPEGQGKKP